MTSPLSVTQVDILHVTPLANNTETRANREYADSLKERLEGLDRKHHQIVAQTLSHYDLDAYFVLLSDAKASS
eukprot:6209278-Pleurochrysis_carterae.AAC.3